MDSIYKVFVFHSPERHPNLLRQLQKQLFELGVPEKKIEIIELDESLFSLGQYRFHFWHQFIVKKIGNKNLSILLLADYFRFHCTPVEFISYIKQFDLKQSPYIENSLEYLGCYDNCIVSLLAYDEFLKLETPPAASSLQPFNTLLGTSYLHSLVHHVSPSSFEFYEAIVNDVNDDFLLGCMSFKTWTKDELFLCNAEPMSIESKRKFLIQQFQPYRKQPPTEVMKQCIDYSYENAYLINKNAPWIYIRILPILFHPKWIFPGKIEKTIDISFIASTVSKRSQHIFSILEGKGIKVHLITKVDMVERLIEILKSRILLLIHTEEHCKIFPYSLASIPLFNFQTVVSEDCSIEHERGINKSIVDGVHFSPYHSIASTCESLLSSMKQKKSFKFTPSNAEKQKKRNEWTTLSQEDLKMFHRKIE